MAAAAAGGVWRVRTHLAAPVPSRHSLSLSGRKVKQGRIAKKEHAQDLWTSPDYVHPFARCHQGRDFGLHDSSLSKITEDFPQVPRKGCSIYSSAARRLCNCLQGLHNPSMKTIERVACNNHQASSIKALNIGPFCPEARAAC